MPVKFRCIHCGGFVEAPLVLETNGRDFLKDMAEYQKKVSENCPCRQEKDKESANHAT